jgi:hypothetical protein
LLNGRHMRLYSYVVRYDVGFAPNPFYGVCTLATCKPDIRKTASMGDLIIGTGSAGQQRTGYLVFVMRVIEIMNYDNYWADQRFASKKPNMHGSMKQAYGDNIYHRSPGSESWIQENSRHSLADGTPNSKNIKHDTKCPRVLISDDFAYFGGTGPEIPKGFRSFDGYDICVARGYKNHFPESLIQAFEAWWRALGVTGYVDRPGDW